MIVVAIDVILMENTQEKTGNTDAVFTWMFFIRTGKDNSRNTLKKWGGQGVKMRTINEKKAQNKMFVGILLLVISMLIEPVSIKNESVRMFFITWICFVSGLVLLLYGSYSLSWEYKRKSIIEKEGEK